MKSYMPRRLAQQRIWPWVTLNGIIRIARYLCGCWASCLLSWSITGSSCLCIDLYLPIDSKPETLIHKQNRHSRQSMDRRQTHCAKHIKATPKHCMTTSIKPFANTTICTGLHFHNFGLVFIKSQLHWRCNCLFLQNSFGSELFILLSELHILRRTHFGSQ